MAATDARPVPKKNVAYRVYFTVLDADGDPVAGAAFDSGLGGGGSKAIFSKDAAAVVNSTNNITEISNGMYYLDISAAEMNFDALCIMFRTTTAGAKNTFVALYPEEAGDIRANLTAIDDLLTTGNNAILNLKKLNVVNSAGDAIVATSSGGAGHGISASGNGAGSGIKGLGGDTGKGIHGAGGATSGVGLSATATATNEITDLFLVTEGSEPTTVIASGAGVGATVLSILQHLKRRFFNRVTQTTSQQKVYRDNSATVLETMAVSDDGTTQSKEKAT